MNMRVIMGLVIGILAIIIFLFITADKQDKINKIALDELNLKLIGIVESVDKGYNFHGYGIIRLRIINSNIHYYDPRTKQEFYFCIIKNGIAEMYDHTYNTFKGDTLTYDTKLKLGGFIRNGEKQNLGSISINYDNGYYDYIKRNTIFK